MNLVFWQLIVIWFKSHQFVNLLMSVCKVVAMCLMFFPVVYIAVSSANSLILHNMSTFTVLYSYPEEWKCGVKNEVESSTRLAVRGVGNSTRNGTINY